MVNSEKSVGDRKAISIFFGLFKILIRNKKLKMIVLNGELNG
jgi:hypothetical protein